MLKYCVHFLLLCSSSACFLQADEIAVLAEDEIKRLGDWIEITEKQLEIQKKLKILMVEFRKQKDLFIAGNEQKAFIAEMITTASKIFTLIKESHIEHLFASDYMQELALFSSIGNKKRSKAY